MRVALLILLLTPTIAEEKWSWGLNQDSQRSSSSSPSKVNFEREGFKGVGRRLRLEEKRHVVDTIADSVRQARKIEESTANKERIRKENTEPRFFGIKKNLCKHGIGINCPDGYDLLEFDEPYESYSPYPTSYGHQAPSGYGFGHGVGYGAGHGVGHYGAGGIDPNQVVAVQPVALQPVGSPIQAVPLGPTGSVAGSGLHTGGTYGTGIPFAGGVGVGSHHSSYGLPAPVSSFPTLGAGLTTHVAGYQAPVESYSPPSQDIHHIPEGNFPAFEPEPTYEEPPQREVSYSSPQVVKHYHTHIHKGGSIGALGLGSFGKDISFSESHLNREIDTRPTRSHRVVDDHHSVVMKALRRGDCECVPIRFCDTADIVGRTRGLPQLDARNNPSNILSTASKVDHQGSASEKQEIKVEPPKAKSKAKREANTSFRVFNDTEGRQVHGTYRLRNSHSTPACPRGEVCCRSDGFTGRKLTYRCGKKNKAGVVGRVSNSKIKIQEGDTQFGEYPWQAAILKRESREVIYVCGGALVNDRHLLTAAHCVNGMKPDELKVRLGEWDVNRKTEFYDHIETNVDRIFIHPEFYSGTLSNDIAVVTLMESVNFVDNPHINPICLPHSNSDFTNYHCHVTGWGKDAFGSTGNFQFILKQVEVPVWGKRGCETALKKTRLGVSYKLEDGMLCAGGEQGKDACKGDGGGPLVCQGADGSMEVAGIVSWGIGCGEKGIPGVYVNVPHYMQWITDIMYKF